MRRISLVLALLALLPFATARTASADITGFLGVSTSPSNRGVRGVGFGVNFLVLGFELEYAHVSDDPIHGAPSLRTGMINGLVQTPTRTQFYVTAGGGFFHQTLSDVSITSFGTNIGGGVKLSLVGPLRLRLDYRVFSLRGTSLYKNPQRFYAGANLTF
jgi:hypothetical protein